MVCVCGVLYECTENIDCVWYECTDKVCVLHEYTDALGWVAVWYWKDFGLALPGRGGKLWCIAMEEG